MRRKGTTMKVLLINGSPHQYGCTYTALEEVGMALRGEGIGADHFWIGKKPVAGCMACRVCKKTGSCVMNDSINEFDELAKEYDGFIFGSPVYYAGMNGSMMSFMDRAFYSAEARKPHPFMRKPAAAVASARRAGTTPTLDQMYKYFGIMEMPIISSSYWNMVHGNTPDEVRQDLEGLRTMRVLGRNMAWYLKLREAGEKAGVPEPEQEPRIATNFIR